MMTSQLNFNPIFFLQKVLNLKIHSQMQMHMFRKNKYLYMYMI